MRRAGLAAGHVACKRRGTFCTVETAPVRGRSVAQTPWKRTEREVCGFSPPRPPNSAQARWEGGDKAHLGLPRRFPTSAKSVDKPLFLYYKFSPLFSLSAVGAQSRAGGGRVRRALRVRRARVRRLVRGSWRGRVAGGRKGKTCPPFKFTPPAPPSSPGLFIILTEMERESCLRRERGRGKREKSGEGEMVQGCRVGVQTKGVMTRVQSARDPTYTS